MGSWSEVARGKIKSFRGPIAHIWHAACWQTQPQRSALATQQTARVHGALNSNHLLLFVGDDVEFCAAVQVSAGGRVVAPLRALGAVAEDLEATTIQAVLADQELHHRLGPAPGQVLV